MTHPTHLVWVVLLAGFGTRDRGLTQSEVCCPVGEKVGDGWKELRI